VAAVIILATLEAVCVGWWEFKTRPDTFGIACACSASLAGVWVFSWMWLRVRRFLVGMPPVRVMQAGVDGPDGRPLYRVLAGSMAGVCLVTIFLIWNGKIRHSSPAVDWFLGVEAAGCGYAFAHLAIRGKWILGGNRMLGGRPASDLLGTARPQSSS